MRGMTEFTRSDIFANQLIIGKIMEAVHKQSDKHLEGLLSLPWDYPDKSMDALRILWQIFEDNDQLLLEAEIKDDRYFTSGYYERIRKTHLYIMAILREFKAQIRVCTAQKEYHIRSKLKRDPTFTDELIAVQRDRFNKLKDTIKGIHIDEICEQHDMEKCQETLKKQWIIIEEGHRLIKIKINNTWPDLTYYSDYIRYRNMYQTTVSLFNYKIDVLTVPGFCVIPHIGIPSWKMLLTPSDVHPFTVTSIAWRHMDRLSDLIHNNNLSEGGKRQLLIRTFLTYQRPSSFVLNQPAEANAEADDNDREAQENGSGRNDESYLNLKHLTLADVD